LPHRTHWI